MRQWCKKVYYLNTVVGVTTLSGKRGCIVTPLEAFTLKRGGKYLTAKSLMTYLARMKYSPASWMFEGSEVVDTPRITRLREELSTEVTKREASSVTVPWEKWLEVMHTQAGLSNLASVGK